MPYIDVEGEIPDLANGFQVYQCYNILDAAVTAQLQPVIRAAMNENHYRTYLREMRVMALCLEMSTKGFPIDQMFLAELLWDLEKKAAKCLRRLHQFCEAVDSPPVNPRSTTAVPKLFYDHLGLPPVYEYDRKTKQRKITSDIKALERLRDNYPVAIPFVNAILAYREHTKMASVFKRGLEPSNQQLRCSFSPSGTDTGRLSSQQNPYGRGTNAQNLTDYIRTTVCAPEGYAILNLDLKTAESIAVGFIAACRAYIDACLTGDVHTAAARMMFKDLPWTGNIAKDKDIAETVFYRWFTHRDLTKKGGHATNYYGRPQTIAQVAFSGQVPIGIIEEFQRAYFAAFPEIAAWHLEVIARIQRDGIIVTQLGRERRFWGRPDDSATHRAAIAYNPQSLVADTMNEGLIQVQEWLLKECRDASVWLGRNGRLLPFQPNHIDLRAQVHDAGVFLIPIEGLDTLAPMVQDRLQYPVDFGELGVMIIPSDMSLGRRWNKFPKKEPTIYTREGLKGWAPGQPLHWL